MTSQFFVELCLKVGLHFIIVAVLSFMFWMAVDASKKDMYWWTLLILGIPLIGSIAYFFVEKKHEYMVLSANEQAKE